MQGGSTNNRCLLPQIGRHSGTLETFGAGLSSVCVRNSSGGGRCKWCASGITGCQGAASDYGQREALDDYTLRYAVLSSGLSHVVINVFMQQIFVEHSSFCHTFPCNGIIVIHKTGRVPDFVELIFTSVIKLIKSVFSKKIYICSFIIVTGHKQSQWIAPC